MTTLSMQEKISQARWPIEEFDEALQPRFVFVLTPPNCGSTAIAKILATSDRSMLLHERGEGQLLVPGLCENDRWDPEKAIDYRSVRSVWLRRYQDVLRHDGRVDVVVEKSPPNMMRIERLAAQFRDCWFIANNRDPYAVCASMLYRYHDADAASDGERIAVLKRFADRWLARSMKLTDLVRRNGTQLMTYETFCRSPGACIERLCLPRGMAESIDPEAEIKVKDYRIQRIENQNERQVSKLRGREVMMLREVFEPQSDLLRFFGYDVARDV